MSPHSTDAQMLSRRDLVSLTGLSATTIWRLRRCGHIPAPLQLSPGRIGWRRSEVLAWLEARQSLAPSSERASPAARRRT